MAETEDWPTVICDAGPLIHLDEIGCLDLLLDFQAILIPEQVRDEVALHRPAALGTPDLEIEILPVTVSSDSQFRALVRAFSLDAGEQAALSLMKLYPDALFLTDDAAARLAAKASGFRSFGSLGVLLRSHRLGRRGKGEILSILRELPSCSTLHVRTSLLQEVIEQVEGMLES
ncbi:MAG TPA: DNA-binding protein [Thermoanaerobaculia bacterium]|jgi:Predicted nucleic acid-binding protein, contains PIN domain|nr:DNA-binding protein [Thermoanaerobaculia bacterium]